MKGNQLRLYLSALAYTLVEALRRLALKGTEWAEAQVDTIRLKLFKIGALVRISARRVWLELSSTYPWKQIYARAFDALLKVSAATQQLFSTSTGNRLGGAMFEIRIRWAKSPSAHPPKPSRSRSQAALTALRPCQDPPLPTESIRVRNGG